MKGIGVPVFSSAMLPEVFSRPLIGEYIMVEDIKRIVTVILARLFHEQQLYLSALYITTVVKDL